MANRPSTPKQERRAAVQAQNPLGDGNLDAELGDTFGAGDDAAQHVPDEFRAPAAAPTPGEKVLYTQEDVREMVAAAVHNALSAPKYSEAEMQDMLARARAEARYSQLERLTTPLSAEQEATVAHISSSGRAPVVPPEERVWIILDDNDEIPPGGQFIGVNGVGYQLLPGVEAFVPKSVCEVLDRAIKSVPVLDPMTKRIIDWKSRKRFAYTVVDKRVSDAREVA